MTCAEFKELAAAYALGALTPEEHAACDEHLAGAVHEGCLEALAEATETVHALALALPPVKPRAELWSAIEADTARAGSTERAGGRARRGSMGAWPWLVAAAMLLVIVWLGWSRVELANRLDGSDRDLAAARAEKARLTDARVKCEQDLEAARGQLALRSQAMAMLALPTGRVVALAPEPGAPPSLRATAIMDLKDRRGMLVVTGLAAQPGKDFELWVIKGDEKRPAGLLRESGGQAILTALDPAQLADGADKLAITLEPAGGSQIPRGSLMLSAIMPKS
jgi:anti-sigma-K factor RskA